jgi:hypothetical protein
MLCLPTLWVPIEGLPEPEFYAFRRLIDGTDGDLVSWAAALPTSGLTRSVSVSHLAGRHGDGDRSATLHRANECDSERSRRT